MPTPDDGPTRRDYLHLSTAVEKLTITLEDLPVRMAEIYVRKDVYDKDQELHRAIHKEHREDINGLTNWKEMILKILVSAVMVTVLGLILVSK